MDPTPTTAPGPWSDDEWAQLEHADDTSGRPLGRRVLRVLLVLGCIVAVVGIVAEGAVWWWVGHTLDRVQRVTIEQGTLTESKRDLPENILVVGSDSRSDLRGADQARFGNATEVEGSRSDTMMVLHADPRTGAVSVLSIPRDVWVTLADTNVKDKINQAFDGGPGRLVRTIEREIGIQINHYIEVDFVGFRAVVDAVGGVPVYVPEPARDSVTGLVIDRSGCVNLVGDQALAYVRSRRFEQYVGGRWRSDPTSDFGRIKRQQGFFRHTLERAVTKGARNPRKLPGLIDAVIGSIAIDDKLSRSDLLRLAKQFRNIDPDAVRTYVLPTTPDVVDQRAVLLVDTARANDVLNRFNGFGPASLKPAQVDVRVTLRNRADADRIALVESLVRRLTQIGFAGADTSAQPARAVPELTVIRHRPESINEAQYFSAFVIGGTELVPDASVTGVDLEMDPGTSFGGLRAKPLHSLVDEGDANDEAVGKRCR